jgi:hypothetical protein
MMRGDGMKRMGEYQKLRKSKRIFGGSYDDVGFKEIEYLLLVTLYSG